MGNRCTFARVNADPSPSPPALLLLPVTPAEGGLRLDSVVVRRTGASRRQVALLLEEGGVRVDGRREKGGTPLREGQEVTLLRDPSLPFYPIPDKNQPLVVLMQRSSWVVVNKPAGMPTHPREATETGTVVNALLGLFPEMQGVGDGGLCPGLAHRLDRETSGALLAARTHPAWEFLRRAFQEEAVEKEYLALVHGRVKEGGRSSLPLMHHGPRGGKMRGASGVERAQGIPARSSWQPIETHGEFSLVRVRIQTGVTHQIRVHLAEAGHPVAGDPLYGEGQPGLAPLHRLALHAHRLTFPDPEGGPPVEVVAPLPEDLRMPLREAGFLSHSPV